MKGPLLRVFGLAIALCAACGGQSIEPLDPRDATLPEDTRRWIAAVEDGVVVARARRDAAADRLEQTEIWRDRLEQEVRWGAKGAELERAQERLAEAQEQLASLRLDRAEAVLGLAQAKYWLANAERAVLHDLARYELQPLHQDLEAARRRLGSVRKAVSDQGELTERATTELWKAYAKYLAQGGDTRPFWIGSASAIRVAERKPGRAGSGQADPTSRSHVDREDIPQNPF